jgi:ATP-dependent exoDNAse (exonuclease V) beta subunit
VLPSYPTFRSDNFETINIFYTAATRAKEKLIVISSEEIINRYLKNKENIIKTIISYDQRMDIINKEYEIVKERLMKPKPENYKEYKINRIYLNVSYNDKDKLKEKGGRFDSEIKKWYIMSNNGMKEDILSKWSEYKKDKQIIDL